MDSAPRFVAEELALKGVDALMKLAIAYIGINRLDGAAECLTCVARACAKPGTEGIERGLEVLGNEECLSALAEALKGPPVSSDAWDGASSSDDESTISRTSSYYSGLPSPAGSPVVPLLYRNALDARQPAGVAPAAAIALDRAPR